ncbi:MAG: tetratricopeptide repeat protein, partial [Candidatus Omnitrophica bacterium]|nr:tetratricopeptide repeat protein [Candidatus Omnitrophota bacterium]
EISAALKALCEYNDVPLIDTEAVLKSQSKGGILSEPVIEDNCHPSLEGQRLMALAVARVMAEKGWLAPFAEWQWKDEKTPAEYLKALGIDDHFLAEANLTLTFYLLNLGENNYDRAIFYALRGLQYEPDSADLTRRLAWLYWLKGDTDEAKKWYRKLGELSPNDLMEVCAKHPEIFKEIGEN